jgi:hypothetical protein
MSYVYKMIQVPRTISSSQRDSNQAAANYVQEVVDQMVRDGWEFYRIDQINVAAKPGCLGALLGQQASVEAYNIISFRKTR